MVLSSSHTVFIGPLFNLGKGPATKSDGFSENLALSRKFIRFGSRTLPLVSSYQKAELKAIALFKDLENSICFYGRFVNTRTMIVITSLTDDQYYLWFLATQQGMPVSSGIPSTSFGRNFCLNILVLKGYQIFSEKLPHSFT